MKQTQSKMVEDRENEILALAEKENKLTSEDDQMSIWCVIPDELRAKLTHKQIRAINLYLAGYNFSTIAELLNYNHYTIERWFKNPDVQMAVHKLQDAEFMFMDSKLKNLRSKAIDRMGELIDSPVDVVALGAAKEILNRTGHTTTQKVEISKTVTNIEQSFKTINPDNIVDLDVEDVLEEFRK